MDKKFDPELFSKTVFACCLDRDFADLTFG